MNKTYNETIVSVIENTLYDTGYCDYKEKYELIKHVKYTMNMIFDGINQILLYDITCNAIKKYLTPINFLDEEYEINDVDVPIEYLSILKHMEYLESLPQHEQKSPEWFADREKCITASMCANALNECYYPGSSKYDYLLDKCHQGPVFQENVFVHHGKKYEQIATMFYENIYDARTTEFGLIPHPSIYFLGASPDGICNQYSMSYEFSSRLGRMLEIKCPKTRIIKTKGKIDGGICPHYYWCQVQQQLECCDLECCDFWQCQIEEYKTREEWALDEEPMESCTEEQNVPIEYVPENIKKGCVIQLIEKDKLNNISEINNDYYLWSAQYIYPPDLNMTTIEYNEWCAYVISNFDEYEEPFYEKHGKHYVFDKIIYWKMVKAHNVSINRDKKWFENTLPKLQSFWNEVEYYRLHEDLVKSYVDDQLLQIKENKKNKKNKKNGVFVKTYAIDYEEDHFIDSDIIEDVNTKNDSDDCLFVSSEDNNYDDDENNINDKLFK
jgi:putative phage-type endonuclease